MHQIDQKWQRAFTLFKKMIDLKSVMFFWTSYLIKNLEKMDQSFQIVKQHNCFQHW